MSAPPELDALMAFLGDAFRRPEPIAEGALASACAEHVTGSARLSPAEQVDIYRRQFWLRHLDSLQEDYPGLEYLLGEDGFDAFCRAYLLAHPPRHPSLRDLGADIVTFAEGYLHFSLELKDAAVEMVRYENAFIDLFDGPEAPRLEADKITRMPEAAWEQAVIVLDPQLTRLKVKYPVHKLRLAAKAGEPKQAITPAETNLVLYRADHRVHFDELSTPAFALLSTLADGVPLGPACARIAFALAPEEAEALGGKVGAWFQEWTAQRWIIDVVLPQNP